MGSVGACALWALSGLSLYSAARFLRSSDLMRTVVDAYNRVSLPNSEVHLGPQSISRQPHRLNGTTRIARVLLVVLYCALCVLSIFMTWWIVALPASWRIGIFPHHKLRIQNAFETAEKAGAPLAVPVNLVLKYEGHVAVQLLHILPGAVWAAAIPLQLHPTLRRTFPVTHRFSGYAFFVSALMMTAGLALIDIRGLIWYEADFPGLPARQNVTMLGLDLPFGANHMDVFRVVGLWFCITLIIAVVSARMKRFKVHERFVYRHIAAGMWVALQRLYIIVLKPVKAEAQKAAFGDGALLGFAFTVLSAEIAIWARDESRKDLKTGRHAD